MPWDLGFPSSADIVNLSFLAGVWVLAGAVYLAVRVSRGE